MEAKMEHALGGDAAGQEDENKKDGSVPGNACDYCRRLKMKCLGKENPPCQRCRGAKKPCTFGAEAKVKQPSGTQAIDKRLQGLEDQMGWIQSSLQAMIHNQQAMGMGGMPGAMRGPGPPGSAMPQQPWPPSQPTPMTAAMPYPPHTYPALPGMMNQTPPMFNPSPTSYPAQASPFQSRPSGSQTALPPRPPSPRVRPRHPLETPDENTDASPDIPLRSLASRLEVARLVADGHVLSAEDEHGREPLSRQMSPSPDAVSFGHEPDGRPVKRARFESDASAKSGKSATGAVKPKGLRQAMPTQKGDLARAFNDPVDMGMCSDEEGRKLVDLFFSACHPFIPVYDPNIDTWDSLRHRSPFSVSVLMLVGKHVEDAGGPPSALQLRCKEHAELIGKSTVFSPVANVEAVQALMVLSCWGDTVWRPGHLAFSIAVDMGLYRCLPYLAETGMGAGKDPQSLEEERSLVIGARVWIALFKLRYEMAYNHGRPVLMTDDDTLMFARKFLEHPLSCPSDSRLVASCELLALRLSLHQPLSYRPSVPVVNLDAKLVEADRDVEDWFRYWDSFYESHGLPIGHFLRESLISQMCHAILYANMRVLHTVKDRKSAAALPEHRRSRVEDAVRAAQRLIDMTLRGKQYKTTFIYANHYQHVGVAFTARTLIRLASLFPDIVDLRQASRDLEQLVSLLSQVPGFQTGQMIEEVLRRARRKRVLPPLSKPPSPRMGHQRLHGVAAGVGQHGMGQYSSDRTSLGGGYNPAEQQAGMGTGYSPDVGSVDSQPMFDFGLAEELLAGPVAAIPGASVQTTDPGVMDPLFDPNLWFSFFPNAAAEFGGGQGGAGQTHGALNEQQRFEAGATDPFAFNGNGDAPLW